MNCALLLPDATVGRGAGEDLSESFGKHLEMMGTATFSVGMLEFDAVSGELRQHSGMRRLEPKAAAVLEMLCERDGKLVSRQQLLDHGWGEGQGSDEALTQAIAQIRRAMVELGERDLIETFAKRGYRLRRTATAQVATVARSAPRKWQRLVLPAAGIAAAVAVVLVLAFPHGARHSLRHALGLGPPSSSGPGH